MAEKKSMDQFCNKFFASVTESAANTLTFEEIQTNVEVFSKQAWIINRLEWYVPKATFDLVINTADMIDMALTGSNNIADLGLNNAAVIDRLTLHVREATAVGFAYREQPLIRDFSALPGGGLIVAPRPLYAAIVGTSLTAVGTAQLRGYFQTKQLTPDEYLELVDFYRIVQ